MIILSHPTANQNVRQTALAFAEAGILREFWTCIHWKEGGLLDRCSSFSRQLQGELRRRSFRPELLPFIRTSPVREWGRLISGQLGIDLFSRHETGPFSMDTIYHSLDRRVAGRLPELGEVKAVYAYDDGALESFRVGKKLGLRCIYDHPTAYFRKVRQLQDEEAALSPEWAVTLSSLGDSPEKLQHKDEELALADVIIVPSTFAKQTLTESGNVKQEVKVVPYGAPPVRQSGLTPTTGDGRLRVLFVGALGQAKGISYLLDAVSRLERHLEFTLVGRRVSPMMPRPEVLNRYRWLPSLPHDELLEEMSRHDVLVFPSLHEGFGLVMAEAMAQGLVVITTPNTAGPDLIGDGVDGFLVPIRSAAAIEEKLDFLRSNAKVLTAMKEAARRKAHARQWESYRQQIASVARALME